MTAAQVKKWLKQSQGIDVDAALTRIGKRLVEAAKANGGGVTPLWVKHYFREEFGKLAPKEEDD